MYATFFYLIIVNICSKPSYYRSMFGRPGTDEVENEYIDGIEILERGLTHPPLKPVSEGKYTSEPIDPNDYPWPGHELRGSCTRERMIEEANEIEEEISSAGLFPFIIFFESFKSLKFKSSSSISAIFCRSFFCSFNNLSSFDL